MASKIQNNRFRRPMILNYLSLEKDLEDVNFREQQLGLIESTTLKLVLRFSTLDHH